MKNYRITEWIGAWVKCLTPARHLKRDKTWPAVRRQMLRRISNELKAERFSNAFSRGTTC